MNKHTKITLQELIRRKEQMLESKAKPKTGTLYIKSLDGTITIESPTASMAKESQDMENGDAYIVYSCVVDPCLKSRELQEAFSCADPMEIVDMVFEPGEIPLIAVECLKLAGYIDGVKAVDELKKLIKSDGELAMLCHFLNHGIRPEQIINLPYGEKLFYKAAYEIYCEDEYEKIKALTGGDGHG